MKRILLLFTFLLAACAPQTIEQTTLPPGTLQPYFTHTPSATSEKPEGLVEIFETPLPTSTPFVYEVQAGDTMSGIAFRFGILVDVLVAANPDVSPNSMSIGTKLNIPSKPANPTDASTSTPVPVSSPQGATVKQIECYPTVDQGMWCFALIYNDTSDVIENLSAQVSLLGDNDEILGSAPALSILDILPPDASLPLMVFFPPTIPAGVRPQAQLLTGIRLQPDDARYLPATLRNTLAQINGSGRNAQVSGTIFLPEDSSPAKQIWVAAVAYDEFGRVVGVRRWESTAGIAPGGSLQFTFEVSSLAGEIERVEFVVEARQSE